MARDIDLNSKQWLDLVFEGKNKQYGAYELRESSSKRHVLAVVLVVIAVLALVYLPKLIRPAEAPASAPLKQQDELVITQIETPVILPEQMPARAVAVTLPVEAVQRTDKFTAPVIVTDVEVDPDDLMLTQSEMTNNGAAIGTQTTVGGSVVGAHPDDPVVAPEPPVVEPVLAPEVWPAPSGDLMKWLSNNIRYPVDAIELGIQGRVVVRFIVDIDGSIGNVEVLRKLHPSCDREAVRVVSKMPKWIPGQQNNRPVAVYYTLPVYFKLQN